MGMAGDRDVGARGHRAVRSVTSQQQRLLFQGPLTHAYGPLLRLPHVSHAFSSVPSSMGETFPSQDSSLGSWGQSKVEE